MTVETDFNFEGKVMKQSIYESVIRSNARLAYEEVDRCLRVNLQIWTLI
jgi:exoribonuclease R